MAENIVGTIPEFTQDSSPAEPVIEEVKQPTGDEPVLDEKETPELPAEKPTDIVSVDTTEPPVVQGTDTKDVAISSLQTERVKLLREIAELRGQKREVKRDQLAQVDKQIDELKDLNPQDVTIIERVLRSKGYMTKEESTQMFYKAVENEEVNKFLDKYPEYKPENDPNDANWSILQKELGFYKLPSDPKLIGQILERAHKGVVKVPSGPSLPIQQRRIQVASSGSGGTQRPSSNVFTFDADKRAMLRQGGFSDEEILNMEKRSAAR